MEDDAEDFTMDDEEEPEAEHYFTESPKSKFQKFKIFAELRGIKIVLNSASGLFSVKSVDKGSSILAEYMELPEKGKILDLGCGYGVIGIIAAKSAPSAQVILTDINRRACIISKENLKANNVKNAEVRQGEFYEPVKNEKFDLILLNPPHTAGKDVCLRLIRESVNHLNSGGSLQIVARSKKGGAPLFKEMDGLFSKTEAIAKKSGYWVYKGLKI